VSKRPPDPEQHRRDQINRAVRQIEALLNTYWSMAATWSACKGDDAELQQRMHDIRHHLIALVIELMPIPGTPLDEYEARLSDQSTARH
jgi:hypothetical protein